MFSTTRRIVGVSVLGLAIPGVVLGWFTGFFVTVVDRIIDLWNGFITWLDSPWGIEHIVASVGTALGSLAITVIVVLIISDA